MYRHLCVPTDGSELSDRAVEQALALAHSLRARVTALRVTTPYHVFAITPEQLMVGVVDYNRVVHDAARRQLDDVSAKAHALGIRCDTLVIEDESPYRAIIAIARERGCDLIAMASHGRRGIDALVLGSETVKVLTHSTIPVLVFRGTA